MTRNSFITAACVPVGMVPPQVINRGLHLEFWGAQNETKNNPQLKACTSLADSYSSSQATTPRKIEGCS